MGETVIVIDTNQIRDSPLLRSPTWTELFSKADEWDLRFVVPEVCFREAVSVVRRKWDEDREAVEKLRVGEFGLSAMQQEMIEVIASKMEAYEDTLRTRLQDLGVKTVPLPDTLDMLDVAQRAIDRRAPYPVGDGTKDAFRDTLIWCTTMEIAAADADREVWLISNNYKDFGDRSTKDVEACPYPLHPHLIEDLEGVGIAGRVQYVRTVGRLAQRLASTYDALPPDEQQALFQRVDWGDLVNQIEAQLAQVVLNPRATALPVRTEIATIRSLNAAPESFHLVDAAMRGAGAWTAQFNQLIQAEIDITDDDGDTSIRTKDLTIAGRLLGAADGSVSRVTVSSIEALQDDPMRRAWDRPTAERFGRIGRINADILRTTGGIKPSDDIFGGIGRISDDIFKGIGGIKPSDDIFKGIGGIKPSDDILGTSATEERPSEQSPGRDSDDDAPDAEAPTDGET